jgi:3-methyl-2-oxobutanoate hydroxymethyltransferase
MTKTVSINTLQQLKANGEKFACVTSYDASFTRSICQAGIEVILVGDSLGMVVQGNDSTVPVSIGEMAYHTSCVSRGNNGAFLIADMPFMSYASPEQAIDSASELMRAGAHMVKLEGGEWLAETISILAERGVPVCSHLGLTPQSVNSFGGFLVQGKTDEQAEKIYQDALLVQKSGASLLVLECIPSDLASKISRTLTIPVIGIGAGADTDAQVLVIHDLLGMNTHPPRFVKDFLAGNNSIVDALKSYAQEVRTGVYPANEHSFS